jgi:hypothetical protein
VKTHYRPAGMVDKSAPTTPHHSLPFDWFTTFSYTHNVGKCSIILQNTLQ